MRIDHYFSALSVFYSPNFCIKAFGVDAQLSETRKIITLFMLNPANRKSGHANIYLNTNPVNCYPVQQNIV